jgi:hypothetical protein
MTIQFTGFVHSLESNINELLVKCIVESAACNPRELTLVIPKAQGPQWMPDNSDTERDDTPDPEDWIVWDADNIQPDNLEEEE